MVRRGRPSTGVSVHTRIPAELLEQIDRLAEERGVPRAVIIRELLAEALRHRTGSADDS
jgi:predicted DNA-binding protein